MANKFKFGLLIGVVAAAVYACGGESKPAAAPEPSTEAMPAEMSDAGTDEEHTMPDGSKMSGHEHDGGMDGMK